MSLWPAPTGSPRARPSRTSRWRSTAASSTTTSSSSPPSGTRRSPTRPTPRTPSTSRTWPTPLRRRLSARPRRGRALGRGGRDRSRGRGRGGGGGLPRRHVRPEWLENQDVARAVGRVHQRHRLVLLQRDRGRARGVRAAGDRDLRGVRRQRNEAEQGNDGRIRRSRLRKVGARRDGVKRAVHGDDRAARAGGIPCASRSPRAGRGRTRRRGAARSRSGRRGAGRARFLVAQLLCKRILAGEAAEGRKLAVLHLRNSARGERTGRIRRSCGAPVGDAPVGAAWVGVVVVVAAVVVVLVVSVVDVVVVVVAGGGGATSGGGAPEP